ncbi:MAG: hypothetical protein ACYC61_16360, partial [Isosphaeraceae bacterium]
MRDTSPMSRKPSANTRRRPLAAIAALSLLAVLAALAAIETAGAQQPPTKKDAPPLAKSEPAAQAAAPKAKTQASASASAPAKPASGSAPTSAPDGKAAKAATASPKASPTTAPDAAKVTLPDPIERQPYRIIFHFACHPSSRIDEMRKAQLVRDWQVLVRRFVGTPWIVTIAPPSSPVLDLDLAGLEKATPAQAAAFEKAVRADAFDKVWVIHADRASEGPGVAFTGREYDTATRRLGPLQRHEVEVYSDASRALMQFTLDLFSPTAMINGEEGGRALLTVRGSSIEPASPAGRVVEKGTVFQPLRLISAKGGGTIVKIIPWTYLQVESVDGPIARCLVLSGLRDPFSRRVIQPNSLAAVGLKPGDSPLRLHFVSAQDKAPGAGYTLTARTFPNGTVREVGMTDRTGRISLKPGFADGLVVLRLLAGNVEPVAEVPAMPGESYEERTIPFDPKYQSVALEAEVESIRDEVVDLIALRARLEARMKARLEGEDWNGLDQTLQEFGKLTPRDEYAKRIAAIKERATKEQFETRKAILTRNAQAQINDVQAMIDRYLDDDTIRAYRRALDEGRQDLAQKEKAKQKSAADAAFAARRAEESA